MRTQLVKDEFGGPPMVRRRCDVYIMAIHRYLWPSSVPRRYSFKSMAIAMMASIRKDGTPFGSYAYPVCNWLELKDYVRVVAYRLRGSFGGIEWIYELTPAGQAYLEANEAPAGEW